MVLVNTQKTIEDIFSMAGIAINGSEPWDIRVNNEEFYSRVIKDKSLGLGESYMAGLWDCDCLDVFFERLIKAQMENHISQSPKLLLKILFAKIFNYQTREKSLIVGRKHYDLNIELFKKMLGDTMVYSCGYWKSAKNLEEAQRNKLALCCEKLGLKRGMKVLDIGCGFGSFCKFAAENYGVEVVGVTISKSQYEFAKEYTKDLPIDIRFQDYRDLNEKFHRIISIGMFEHVGPLNYATYFNSVNNCLEDDGIFLLHTIGNNKDTGITDEWIAKYIFPNGALPTISQIASHTEGMFIMEDWHNFGENYDKTLMCWHENFNTHWNELKQDYDDEFYRMWNYYLLSCAAAFRVRDMQLWQVVFSKHGVEGGYVAPR